MDVDKFTPVHVDDYIDELDDFDNPYAFDTITLADGTEYIMASLEPGNPEYIRVMNEITGK